ncbi:MAG: mce4F [Nocardia sp.]|uniref:MCE family protein n=1 Tax=Nocardia sp. TaxID=1821 RepID=UPI002619E0D0|nr:MCE family protein [Nocardia sp.]MCU1643019.1 mce4F [Nocardia sp.]
MLSKRIRIQLIVFTVIAVLSVGFCTVKYAGLQRFTKIGTYTVAAVFVDASGLYPNALVTYRGVDVGVVRRMELRPDGAAAILQLQSSREVPADSDAIVRSVSAVGEQYVDLVPRSSGAPYLHEGSTLGTDRTRIPEASNTVVSQVNTLLQSVPKESLKTTVDEASAALGGTGEVVNQALAASASLVRRAHGDLQQTTALIDSAEPVLQALSRSGPSINAFATNLASFTDQLVMSDAHIREVLSTGPAFFDTVGGTLSDLTPTLPLLLMNLQTAGEVLRVNAPGLRHLLVVYPALSSAINYMHNGFQDPNDRLSGQGPLDVKLLNTGNPFPCTEGYQETQRRDPSDLSPVPAPENAYCKLPQSDNRDARGVRNAPCATDPSVRTANVADCPGGPPSQWPQMMARPGQQPVAAGSPPDAETNPPTVGAGPPLAGTSPPVQPAAQTVPYDPQTGRFRTPDGIAYSIQNLIATGTEEELEWQQLFLK